MSNGVREGEFPPIGELVPHSARMRLLSRVVGHGSDRTECIAEAEDSALFCEPDGRVPAWVGLEYMAQCIAVDSALRTRGREQAAAGGLLLGSRHLRFETSHFESGQVLRVSARYLAGERKLSAFACEIRDSKSRDLLAAGRLSVYLLADQADLQRVLSDGR